MHRPVLILAVPDVTEKHICNTYMVSHTYVCVTPLAGRELCKSATEFSHYQLHLLPALLTKVNHVYFTCMPCTAWACCLFLQIARIAGNLHHLALFLAHCTFCMCLIGEMYSLPFGIHPGLK